MESASNGSPRRRLRSAIAFSVGFGLVAAWVIAHASRSLGPQTAQVPLFNSDTAIPVLMANAPTWRFFDLYYWGQDRFGAWPFLIARAVHGLAGIVVTPERLHLGLCVWLLVGALALDRLTPRLRGLAAGIYAASILAVPTVRSILFDLMQVYPWQIPSVLLAWWALRACSTRFASAAPVDARETARRFVLPCFAAALAIWTSTVSAPLLWILVAIEAVRLRACKPDAAVRRFAVGGGLAVLVPVVMEATLRGAYHRYSLRWFHDSYATGLRLDLGHLAENARAIGSRVIESRLLGGMCIGAIGGALAVAFLLRTLRRGRPAEPAHLDHASLIAGLALTALSQPVLLIAVEHVRLNLYSMRYLLPMLLLGTLAAGLTLATPVFFIAERLRGWVGMAGGLAACVAGVAALPPPGVDARYAEEQRTAATLAELAPGAPLLGRYWNTYVFAALAPPGQLIPLPHETDYRRTVWLEERLSRHPEVLVAHGAFPAAGPAAQPERWIRQFGTWLELERPSVLRGAGRVFSLYRQPPSPLEALNPSALASFDLCRSGDAGTLRFAPRSQVEVLVALTRPRKGSPEGPVLAVTPLSAQGRAGEVIPMRAVDRLRSAEISGRDVLDAVRLSVLKPAQPSDGDCTPESIAVFAGPSSSGFSGSSAP